MKATKKIVGAACALVAAVALSAGSTFAWFTSNGSVEANGLKIDVNTSNAYLIIADSAANLKNNEDTLNLAPAAGTDVTKLLPSAYEEDAEDLTVQASWYTGKGTSTTDGGLKGDKTVLTSSDFAKYVIETDIFVSVAEGSDKVDSVIMEMSAEPTWTSTNEAAKNNDAISVVILYQTMENKDTATLGTWNKVEANAKNSHVIGTAGKLDLGAIAANNTEYIRLHIMVYFDGNNEDVTTANSANLTGVVLSFSFTDGSTSAGA